MSLLTAIFSRAKSDAQPKAADQPPPKAVLIDPDQTVPSYPDPGLAVPVVASRDLLAAQSSLIAQLVQTLGLDGRERALLLDPVLERFANYIHLLPASETHHHCGIGGMLRHCLEVAFYAARYTEGAVFGMDLPPELRHPYASRARLVTAYAGLLHDIGKPLVDIGALDPISGQLWNPHVQPLVQWCAAHGVASYTLFWHPGARHRRHENFSAALVHQILGQEVLAYLGQGQARELIDVLFMAIGNTPDLRHPIAEAVKRGDSASVEFDLERQSQRTIQAAGGSVRSLATRLVHAMQTGLREGAWKPNTPGQPVWVTSQGVFLGYPDIMHALIDRIRTDGKAAVPARPEVLLAALREGSFIRPYQAAPDAQEADTWPIEVKVGRAPAQRLLAMRAVRLDSPSVLFGSDPLPDPVEVTIDGIDPAAKATPVQQQDAPLPSPATSHAAPQDDAADAQEPIIRKRREEADLADRRATERAAAAATTRQQESPSTPEQANQWLDRHPPLGEVIKAVAHRIATASPPLSVAQPSGLLVAYPKGFEGLGLPVERIAQLLMEQRWITTDAATPDRATISAPIAGTQQIAVRFTRPVSAIVQILAAAAQGGHAQASSPEQSPPQSSAQAAQPKRQGPPLSLEGEPGDPSSRAAFRKVAFYQFVKTQPGLTLSGMGAQQAQQVLAEFARTVERDVDELAQDLALAPNALFMPGSLTPSAGFRYDKARAQAGLARQGGGS